jgi:hypothetical protein
MAQANQDVDVLIQAIIAAAPPIPPVMAPPAPFALLPGAAYILCNLLDTLNPSEIYTMQI